MGATRWLARLGPPILILGAIGAMGTAAPAIGRLGPHSDCRIRPADIRLDRPAPSPDMAATGAWFRLETVLDATGTVAGQTLQAGTDHRTIRRSLPPESSAAGPFGDGVLVATDDGRASTLLLLDARLGCAVEVGQSDDVIRRVTLDVAGAATYEHRVDRRTRQSLGIWRRAIDGTTVVRVLAPVADDARFGPTFSTELAWSADGSRLVVQSCGALRCRSRILDLSTGASTAVADLDQGELIGLAGDALVTYGACAHATLPCSLVSTNVRDGRRTIVATDAGLARMYGSASDVRVAFESGGIGSGTIRIVTPNGSDAGSVSVAPEAMLAPSVSRAGAGYAAPPGWFVVSDDGRPDGAAHGRRLVRAADAHVLTLAQEVIP